MLRKIGRRLTPSSDVSSPDGTGSDHDSKFFNDDGSTELLTPYRSVPSPSDERQTFDDSTLAEKPSSDHLQSEQHGCGSRDRLGLSLVHACAEPLADLIFVHGLGGSSRSTWSWQRDPRNFWPGWLRQETELCRTRVFTFGYDSNIFGQDNPRNIIDFAKELLFQMKIFDTWSVNDHPIGEYPLIFVMHSMGGLVVKKAYILGKSDEEYASIISQIRAMLFFATPHRGSTYADFLNNILRTIPGRSAKLYVSDLEKTSTTLQYINEQFRIACGDIKLVSLYENYRTNVGLGVRKIIVNKESAVLGYPSETSSGLNADHHGVCKFSDTNDPNYVQVRSVLRMFIRALKPPAITDSLKTKVMTPACKVKLEKLLGIHDDPTEDFDMMRDRIMGNSCQWILRRSTFSNWMESMDDISRILCLTGLPAVGKSVLSSFIVDFLQKDPSIENCFYYFFKSEHQTKRTVGQMLRSIAFQMAIACASFREKLLEIYDSGGLPFGRQKVNTIWETIFEGIIFRQEFATPLFWVIDGLDEADHPKILIKILSKLRSRNCIRILIVSRPMRELATNLGNNVEVVHDEISVADTLSDIKAYIHSAISTTVHGGEVRDDICARVLEKAHGSFLWVTLAVDQLKDNWHTLDDVSQVLHDLPEGMELLYVRMIQLISEQAPRPRAIALRILTWTVCAFRPLRVAELEIALESEFGGFLSLKDTITQICGSFVIVRKSQVMLIHDTARQFLLHRTEGLPLTIDHRAAHEHIATTCLKFLMNSRMNWKRIFALSPPNRPTPDAEHGSKSAAFFDTHPFLFYAVTWWAYHVSFSPARSDLASLVCDYLESSCLVWINAIALTGNMRALTRAAQYIKVFVRKGSRKTSNESLRSLTGNRDDELKQWAKDLIRLVGRFGSILTQSPESVHKHIVPFCPKGSIIGRTYSYLSRYTVMGLSNELWDDCLAHLTFGNREYASKVFCKGNYFITLTGTAALVVWHAESCEEARRIDAKEPISAIEFSRPSSPVVTAGTKMIRAWDVTTGEELLRLPKVYPRRVLALSLSSTGDELLLAYDDSSVHCIDLATSAVKWSQLLIDPDDEAGRCPYLISFSPDNSQVLMGYRGRPVLAWSLDSPAGTPLKCVHAEDRYTEQHDTRTSTAEHIVWRPELPVALILDNCTSLVEWNVEDDLLREILEVKGALEMTISPDGNLLVTSDYNGAISIWTVPEFRLTYHLRASGVIRSLAFSPDGQRVYSVRGTLCNVWEPDALVRPEDLDREELSSTQDTLLSEANSASNQPARPQITALTCDGKDSFYCCGKDSGAVVLYDLKTGEKIRMVSCHSKPASVIEIAWSSSYKFIASADNCGSVIAKRLRKPTGEQSGWSVYPLFNFQSGGAILQLLFSPSEEYLLVSAPTCARVWCLKSKKEKCLLQHPLKTGHRWINDPVTLDHLICIDSEEIQVRSWNSLETIRGTDLNDVKEHPDDMAIDSRVNRLNISPSGLEEKIERAITLDLTRVIFEVSPLSGTRERYMSRQRIKLFDAKSSQAEQQLQPQSIDELSGKGNRLIGTFHGHVVFLDDRFSICTWDPNRGTDSFKRHFYLPKDFLSPGMLKLCTINSSGTIMCPKNGEVAILRSWIKL